MPKKLTQSKRQVPVSGSSDKPAGKSKSKKSTLKKAASAIKSSYKKGLAKRTSQKEIKLAQREKDKENPRIPSGILSLGAELNGKVAQYTRDGRFVPFDSEVVQYAWIKKKSGAMAALSGPMSKIGLLSSWAADEGEETVLITSHRLLCMLKEKVEKSVLFDDIRSMKIHADTHLLFSCGAPPGHAQHIAEGTCTS
jgi:hypothetical protein